MGVPVLTPRVDIANARLRFASGLIANLTASRVSAEKVRKFRVFSPRTYISADFAAREAQVYRLADGSGGTPGDRGRADRRPPTRSPCGASSRPSSRRSGTGRPRSCRGRTAVGPWPWPTTILARMATSSAGVRSTGWPQHNRASLCAEPTIWWADRWTAAAGHAKHGGFGSLRGGPAVERFNQRQGFLVSALVHLTLLMILASRASAGRSAGARPSPSPRRRSRRVFMPPADGPAAAAAAAPAAPAAPGPDARPRLRRPRRRGARTGSASARPSPSGRRGRSSSGARTT